MENWLHLFFATHFCLSFFKNILICCSPSSQWWQARSEFSSIEFVPKTFFESVHFIFPEAIYPCRDLHFSKFFFKDVFEFKLFFLHFIAFQQWLEQRWSFIKPRIFAYAVCYLKVILCQCGNESLLRWQVRPQINCTFSFTENMQITSFRQYVTYLCFSRICKMAKWLFINRMRIVLYFR